MEQLLIPRGELENDVLAYLNKAGLGVDFDPPRSFRTTARALPIEVIKVRAGSVPDFVYDPRAKNVIAGITGSDILAEKSLRLGTRIPIDKLVPCYRQSYLFVGVSEKFAEENKNKRISLKDLEGCEVATKYPQLTKNFFQNKGILVTPFEIPGTDEAVPYLLPEFVPAIFGIWQSGNTAKANGIKVIKWVENCGVNLIKRPTTGPRQWLSGQLEKIILNP